jgi:hypothetical protein
MREKLSAESVIAETVASFRNTRASAHDIAKTIIRDLNHFGYDIQPPSKVLNDEATTDTREEWKVKPD